MKQRMYLVGEKYIKPLSRKRVIEDGFEVSRRILDLAFWQVDADLHDYIIETFGNDEISGQIKLEEHHLLMIINTAKENTNRKAIKDVENFSMAFEWLNQNNEWGIEKTVFYIIAN